MKWLVHKFGGTSLADPDCFRRVADIVLESGKDGGRQAVVVSAMAKVTDQLLGLIESASTRQDVSAGIEVLRARYVGAARALLDAKGAAALADAFERDIADIESVLKALSLVRAASHRSRDLVSGFGEIWSARLLTAYLQQRASLEVMFINARDVLIVDKGEMGPIVVWGSSRENLAGRVPGDYQGLLVITGYIASTRDGLPTTLGRNGSDFSAAIFGALLDAREVQIWTDVDGVMSGDPRRVPEAKVIDRMSYNEAMELAYFGAKVIHPQTMAPAVAQNIPLRIRNTFNLAHAGTLISATPEHADNLVKGISGVDKVALVNLEGAGMIGVPGTADRLFGALRDAGVSVMLISQGSSEHSICFAVHEDVADSVQSIVERAFAVELAQGQVQKVEVRKGCGILAVVGDGMAGLPGSSGRFFSTLGKAGINVRAIAQGASERNISAVIAGKDMTRALRAVHSSFYLSAKTVSIGIIGPGLVGRALLSQLASESARLRETFNLDLRVRALATSRRMHLAEVRLDTSHWQPLLEAGEATDLERFVEHLQTDYLPHTVIIDCSASGDVAERYVDWLSRGIHVITPNKRAHSGPIAYSEQIKQACRASSTHFLYEATVGAGLPIIQTVKDLVETGDEINSVSGILSGTLAYLFNVFDGQQAFSAIVREARAKGYTEPDPRDDLSGMDVARKAVILARESGLALELSDIEIESLVPPALAGASVEEFLERLSDFDAPMAARVEQARSRGQVLRYVADIDIRSGKAAVRLGSFPLDHPFANISLTDNIVQFVTRRYCANPLIVRGPGAGPEVTAAGIFADLLRLCSMLGPHQY